MNKLILLLLLHNTYSKQCCHFGDNLYNYTCNHSKGLPVMHSLPISLSLCLSFFLSASVSLSLSSPSSFTSTDRYTQKGKGPIKSPVLLVTDPTGKVIHKWGKSLFYLPHGLSIDMAGIIWMTDVARHQIFKLSSIKKKGPLALGKEFVPGSDETHFCKPAAVLSDPKRNRIYVADG